MTAGRALWTIKRSVLPFVPTQIELIKNFPSSAKEGSSFLNLVYFLFPQENSLLQFKGLC